MVRFTVEFADNPNDLAVIIAVAEQLRARHEPSQPTGGQPATAWNVANWLAHLGQGSRSFWEIAAGHAQTQETWTFDDLVATSGVDKNTLRSYHRNSYRAIRDENAPDPLTGNWNVIRQCNVYSMPDAVRDEILRIIQEEVADDDGQAEA